MRISIITLFPEMISGFINQSIIKRARDKKLIFIDLINLRDFSTDNYKTVDDKPYGGGAGMVLMVQPLVEAIKSSKFKVQSSKMKQKIILTTPRGKVFNQQKAQQYSKFDHLVIIAGHYEGVDDRINNYIDEEISIGDYVLTGGEMAAVVIADAVTRLLPGVINRKSTDYESFFTIPLDELLAVVKIDKYLKRLQKKNIKSVRLIEYPQYTRPRIFNNLKVPEVLINGNHSEIKKWQIQQAYKKTLIQRPDLLQES